MVEPFTKAGCLKETNVDREQQLYPVDLEIRTGKRRKFKP
jgi:hypothetical protein